MLVEFDPSLITGGDLEFVQMIAHPDALACHGIFTLRKVMNIEDKMELMVNRKRRVPRQTVTAKRKKKRFQCAHCNYASPEHYLTARHVARIPPKSIPPTKCKLCDFQTIYISNLKRHHE